MVNIFMPTKLKKLLFTVVIIMSSTIFAFALSEGILRIIGFSFTPYATEVQFGWPEPLTMKELYQPDTMLLWVPKDYYFKITEWVDRKPSIVFMGDSCTEFGRYDSYIEKIITNEHPFSGFTFVNVGVGGWSTYQGLQQLKRDILPMKPLFITIYYGWNDHWCSFGMEDKIIGEFNIGNPPIFLKFSKLRVVQLINATIFTIKYPNGKKSIIRSERVPLRDFKLNLFQMVRIAKKNGIIPILLTAPSSHEKGAEPKHLSRRWLNNLNDLVPIHEKYVEAVRYVALIEQVPLIDLSQEFHKVNRNDLRRLFKKDGIHLTEEGNKKIAEIIYKCLKNFGLIDRLIVTN